MYKNIENRNFQDKKDIITIDTNDYTFPEEEKDIFISRSNISKLLYEIKAPIVSILIIAYNRIEKTKQCVESVLQYTNEIDYELILVDNGSIDSTLEYFESIAYDKKRILRITKNLHLSFGLLKATKYCFGKYIALLANDIIVTQNWMKNILKCFESDIRIGMICPTSSNVSNLQQADIQFNCIEEMQEKASKYNKSDSKKWHERLRLITIGAVYKSECIDICGNWDYGFFHDFADDDLTFHIRRAGYKTILCKDVFIHHDHIMGTEKSSGEFQNSIINGMEKFKKKYYGINPWDDINNYEIQMINMIRYPENINDIKVLGIDVLCGTPILEIKNKLREFDIYDAKLYSFTESAKYYIDLCTICDGNVECDRVEYISEYFNKGQFDYIICDKPLNLYSEPFKFLNDCLPLLNKNGQLLIKFRNTYDVQSLIYMLGDNNALNEEYPINLTISDLNNWLLGFGYSVKEVKSEVYNMDSTSLNKLNEIVKYANNSNDVSDSINKMMVRNYILSISV